MWFTMAQCWVRRKTGGPWASFIQFSHSVISDSLRPCGLQNPYFPVHHQLTELAQIKVYELVMPSNHLIFCHALLLLPSIFALWSFPMNQFFQSGGQSIGVSASASVLPMNIQDWFPLGLTGLISLQFKGLSRVCSNTTVQKHQFFSTQLSL